MEAHGHHAELLEGFIVGWGCTAVRVEAIRLLDGGVGASAAEFVGARREVKRAGRRMSVSQTTRISERCRVDFHC